MKNLFRVTALLLMVVLCLGMLASCGDALSLKDVEKDPYAAITAANQKYIDAIDAKYGKVLDAFDKMKDGVASNELKVEVPEVGNIAMNIVSDAATGAYNGKLSVGAEGISAEAKLWGDKNNIALSIPALLGDKNYGIKLDTFGEDIKKAPIIEAMGMTYDDLVAALEAEMGIKLDDIKESFKVEDIENVYKKYVTDVEAIIKGKTPTVAEETVGEVEVITIEYAITKADFEKVVGFTVDMYKSLIGDMAATLELDFDEIMSEFKDSIAEENIDFKYKYYLVKKDGSILKSDFIAPDVIATMNFSTDSANPFNLTIDMKMKEDGEEIGTANITVKESDDEGMAGVYVDMKIESESEKMTGGFSFILNTSSHEYEFEVIADGTALVAANGELTYSENEFGISVDSATVGGETVELGISYTAKAGGTVEAIPEYSNLVTMGMDAYEALITEFTESELGSVIMALAGSSDDYYDDEYYDDEYYDDYYDDEYYDDEDIDG